MKNKLLRFQSFLLVIEIWIRVFTYKKQYLTKYHLLQLHICRFLIFQNLKFYWSNGFNSFVVWSLYAFRAKSFFKSYLLKVSLTPTYCESPLMGILDFSRTRTKSILSCERPLQLYFFALWFSTELRHWHLLTIR